MSVLVEQFELGSALDVRPRFNIAPTQPVAVARRSADDAERQPSLLHWGLIPSWAKERAMGARMINARSETAAEKPSFRAAFRRRRCLVLADGYYEWQKRGKRKQPYFLRLRDDAPFAFAGLWEHWPGTAEQEAVESCTILTTEPNELSRPIHDRMPVILRPDDYELWLDPTVQEPAKLKPLLGPYDSTGMSADPVSTYVNNPRHEGQQCVEIQRELFE
jgi:putative SOS response-associated peptidase YedK